MARPRKSAATPVLMLPEVNTAAHDAAVIIPPSAVMTLKGWKELNQEEANTVLQKTQQLVQARIVGGLSRIAEGEALATVQPILTAHNIFGQYLRKFRCSQRTCNRRIAAFKNAKAKVSENIIKAAIARGLDIMGDTAEKPLGIYTAAAAKLPPPADATIEQANTWLDQLDKVRKEIRKADSSAEAADVMTFPITPGDPTVMLKECYRFFRARFQKLPNNAKTRAKFVNSLIGMELAELGVQHQQTVAPVAIPEDFRAQRGRPALQVAGAA